jgi:hypothetical protein
MVPAPISGTLIEKVDIKTLEALKTDIANIQLVASKEYSAFEVKPSKIALTEGYTYEVPACTIHKMTLRSAHKPADCDVVIDWGDGVIEAISGMTWSESNHIEGKSYELEHDYANSMTSDVETFIVKIYGKNYYTFRYNSYVKYTR